jgi:hypothetical protein
LIADFDAAVEIHGRFGLRPWHVRNGASDLRIFAVPLMIWITRAVPLRRGRPNRLRRRFDHSKRAFGASGRYDRVS